MLSYELTERAVRDLAHARAWYEPRSGRRGNDPRAIRLSSRKSGRPGVNDSRTASTTKRTASASMFWPFTTRLGTLAFGTIAIDRSF